MFEAIQSFGYDAFALIVVSCGGSGFFVSARSFSMCAATLAGGSFQTRDLSLDHRDHFDAEVVAFKQGLKSGNRASVAACTEREDARHADRKVRFTQIRGDLAGDLFVVFLKARETG